MRLLAPAIALAMAGAALPGCDKPVQVGPGTSDSPNAPAPATTLQQGSRASHGPVAETITTAKVKAAIAADAAMKGSDIAVRTEAGVVTLSGVAKSPEQVTIATNLAQRQEGVTRVRNEIALR